MAINKQGRRAQAAMEFMMTYGWVIIVVVAAVGVLSLIGFMNPSDYAPERCLLPITLSCIDSEVSGEATDPTFALVLQNSAGFALKDVSLSLMSATDPYSPITGMATSQLVNCTQLTGLEFVEDEIKTVNISCTGTTRGAFKGRLILNYTNVQTKMSHQRLGEIVKNIN